MARARNIKPAIMDNDVLSGLAPLTRLLFIYLWMLADREGRLEDRPKRIAAQALPFDREADVPAMLNDLAGSGFITRYTVDGAAYIQINNFTKHQRPHVKEQDSSLPALSSCQGAIHKSTTKEVREHSLGGAKAVPGTNLGNGETSPRSPDSLIPDSLIPDCGLGTAAPSAPAMPPPVGGVPPLVETPKAKSANTKASKPLTITCPEDVESQVWGDWQALRKAKNAPVTTTVVEHARKEAGKVNLSLEDFLRIWCARGSQGMEASWLMADEIRATKVVTTANGETPRQLRNRQRLAEFTGGLLGRDENKTLGHHPSTIDMEPVNDLPFALGR